MTDRESKLTWTMRDGFDGTYYRASYEADGKSWKITVDQMRPGQWRIRGWLDGTFSLYRCLIPTLREAKRLAELLTTGTERNPK